MRAPISEGSVSECWGSQRVENPGFPSEEQGHGPRLLTLKFVQFERMVSWGYQGKEAGFFS